MNNWDLINLERKLTKEEYFQLYDALLKDETIHLKWKEPYIYDYINKVRLKLKYLSKSSKATFNWCPQQFNYARIILLRDNKKKGEKMFQTLYGKYPIETFPDDASFLVPTIGANCHFVCEKIWDKINIEKVKRYRFMEDISKYFYDLCLTFIPKEEIARSVYEYFFKQYADYEANRISEIINEKGFNCDKYIIPAYREVKIENKRLGMSGVIDTIYLLLDDTYGINDFKFGKVHYYGSSKWDKIGIEIEIAEYFSLLQDGAFRVINTKEMVEMEHLVVERGRILYLRDWINTYEFIKITPEMILRTHKTEIDIIECINKGFFKRRITQYCMANCDYQKICEKSKFWQDKWNSVDSKLKIEMFEL